MEIINKHARKPHYPGKRTLIFHEKRFICKLTVRQDRRPYNEQITRFVKFTLFSNKTRSTRLQKP